MQSDNGNRPVELALVVCEHRESGGLACKDRISIRARQFGGVDWNRVDSLLDRDVWIRDDVVIPVRMTVTPVG